MNNTVIRPAGFEDAEAIFALIRENVDRLLPRPMGDIVQNIDRFLVSEKDGHITGAVSWQILPEIGAPRNPSVEIKSLAVDENHRSSGVGRALVADAVRHIRAIHPAQIVSLTFVPEFFSKLGFRQVEKRDLMHKLYSGCINCTKYDSPFTCPETAMALDITQPLGSTPE